MDILVEAMSRATVLLANNYQDNWDFERFKPEREYVKPSVARWLKRCLAVCGVIRQNDLQDLVSNLIKESRDFEFLYHRLADASSRELLVQLLLYRVLGHTKVKLPLSGPKYWQDLKMIKQLEAPDDGLESAFGSLRLTRYDLRKLGFDLRLYFSAQGVLTDFVVGQYVYRNEGIIIGARAGDVVIDGGGCWGDTALLFAHEVGSEGRVFSFEFAPFNLTLFRRNLALNPHLASRIEIIEQPIWESTGMPVYVKENGPSSQITYKPILDFSAKVLTCTIDELVNRRNLNRVDMIKLDIEGAELQALKGAMTTLCRFRPNLVVALYHSSQDFDAIPRFIDSMQLGYRFYLGHSTIHKEETMLFATFHD